VEIYVAAVFGPLGVVFSMTVAASVRRRERSGEETVWQLIHRMDR